MASVALRLGVTLSGLALALPQRTAAAADPSLLCRGDRIGVVDGALQLARQWQVAFAETFDQGAGSWRVSNFEGKLNIAADDQGETGPALRVGNLGQRGDTAFELTSPAVPVAGAVSFRLAFSWRANRALTQRSGHKGLYETQVQWVDGQGAVIGAVPIALGPASTTWRHGGVEGSVPAGAASAVIRFGWDSPNLEDQEWFALDNLVLDVQSPQASYEPRGEAVSRPLHEPAAGTALAWEAELPAGTAIGVRVASAPDVAGVPGGWSDFVGPDGTAATAFTAPGTLPAMPAGRPWRRYAVALSSRDPRQTPVLRRVTLGGVTDGPWQGVDQTAPLLAERTATRTGDARAPIGFRLVDATGVDPQTVRVFLDGRDITGAVSRTADRYLYVPPQALAPPPPDTALGAWGQSNYRNALTIGPAAARLPGAAPGVRVQREAGETDTSFRLESPRLPVQPGATYSLRFWVRHALDLQGASSRDHASAGALTWLDAQGASTGAAIPIRFGPAQPDWSEQRVTAVAPAEAASARIWFGFDQPNLCDGAFVDLAEVSLDGPRPERAPEGPNLHRIAVEAADFAGNRLAQTWHVLVRPPRTQGVVSIRDDGMTLIDGQPFFPIGLYAVWKKPFNDNSFDKAFADLRTAGFNLAHTYSSRRGPDFTEFYAAAQRHGIKLYVASGVGANCTRVETVLADVIADEAQPALLAWYLADDTASHVGSAELRALSGAIRDVDPAHITVQADGVGTPPSSRYRAYVDSTDGFLPELYPVRQGSAGVPQIIADMKLVHADLAAAGTRQRTLWAIVQYFQGWGWERYPTRDELWAMSYLSIIHGAHGITWYTYGGWGDNHGVTDTPETWATICALAGELAKLQEVLVEPTPAQPPPPEVMTGPAVDALGQPSLSVLLKRHAGRHYLLAANSAAAAVSCRIPVAAPDGVTALRGERRITPDGAGFVDTFPPYGVQVYVWTP